MAFQAFPDTPAFKVCNGIDTNSDLALMRILQIIILLSGNDDLHGLRVITRYVQLSHKIVEHKRVSGGEHHLPFSLSHSIY